MQSSIQATSALTGQYNGSTYDVRVTIQRNQGPSTRGGLQNPAAADFVIGIDGTNDGLFRNNAVPEGEFPVGVADRMSITSNTTDSPLDYFYYFYRWVVESPCAEPTGISTPDPALSVHPNPTSGALTLSGLTQGDWVSVLNPLGREVHGAQVNQAQTVLNLSGLPSGLYLLQAGTEKSVRVILRD